MTGSAAPGVTTDWTAENRAGREAVGQALGRAAFQAETVEGLFVPSAIGDEAENLVIFPKRLRPGSRLRVLQGGTQ